MAWYRVKFAFLLLPSCKPTSICTLDLDTSNLLPGCTLLTSKYLLVHCICIVVGIFYFSLFE